MASTSTKPRTTRFSFEYCDRFDENEVKEVIESFNCDQEKSAKQKKAANPSSRFSPLTIGRLYYNSVAESKTKLLAYTKTGQQFEFTKWNDFVHKVFDISETMKDSDKFAQIKDFSACLKRAKFINFDGGAGCKRGVDDGSDDMQTPTKKIVLGDSYPAVRVGDGMMKQTKLVAVFDHAGTKECDSSDGSGAQAKEADNTARFFQMLDEKEIKKMLHDFLIGTGKTPVFKPLPALVEPAPGGSMYQKYKDERRAFNTMPSAMKLIQMMFPPFFKTSKGRDCFLGKLSSQHLESLMGLERLILPSSWQGIYTLYMTVDSQELTYDIPMPESESVVMKKACFTEVWRRALNLEGALAKLAVYFSDIIGKTQPAALNVVSRQTIGNVVAFLSAGPGLYVEEGCFWKKRQLDFLQKLSGFAADPVVLETLKWLDENRGDAFTALYPKAHELDVLIPVMAYIFNIRKSLGDLNNEETVVKVVEGLREEIKSKIQLYVACMLRTVLYGARCTG